MALEVHVYPGRTYYPQQLTHDDEKKMTVASLTIQSLFNAGEPFWTRDRLRHVQEQLQGPFQAGQKIWVTALDGVSVDFDIETGLVLPRGVLDLEMVVGIPFISYTSFQELLAPSNVIPAVPCLAYSNLRIFHLMTPRNKNTKEIIPANPTRSLTELREYFRDVRVAWEGSLAFKQLMLVLTSSKELPKVNKIVAFGCGSMGLFSPESWARRSSFQHALILTLHQLLSEKCSNEVQCYAQDPAYDRIDIQYLGEEGVVVVADPQGFIIVDDSTLVVSCAPDVPVKQIVSDLAQPAMMIWDRVCERDSGELQTDPDSPRVRKMIQDSYDLLGFPLDSENFGDVGIYVKRTISESTQQSPKVQ